MENMKDNSQFGGAYYSEGGKDDHEEFNEEDFLNKLIKNKEKISVYLSNRVRLEGIIIDYNKDSIILLNNNETITIVKKLAIASAVHPESSYRNFR